jgi:hypothetical protein
MKLAILGSSPLALEAALRFHAHGAALTWFRAEEIQTEKYFQDCISLDSFVTELGLEFLQDFGQPYIRKESFDWDDWKTHYERPLLSILTTEQKIRSHEVVSITKRYRAPSEHPKTKSRFADVFRVIFQVDPQDFIKEQEANNPETFERLSQELVDSLQTNLEMYEDFDLVLDLRRATLSPSLSVTGRALGEGRVSRDHLKYGYQALDQSLEINRDTQDVRELALVGSTPLAAAVLISLGDWLKDPRSRLFVVSDEEWPFEAFYSIGDRQSVERLKLITDSLEQEFQLEVNEFHQKLREWQTLDDFIQAKKPRPVEPIPRLVFFSGHAATAVDQLIDKRRLFLTLEKPDFKEGLRQPENNHLDLKTIGIDRILVANELEKAPLMVKLQAGEKGYFSIISHYENTAEAWTKNLEKLKGIENEVFKLFSPTGTH